MKHILLILTILLSGCLQDKTEAPKQPEQAKPEVPATQSITLLWGSGHPEWDKALFSEIAKHDWSGIKMPCSRVSKEECAARLISAIAKRESNFKPETKYNETGHLAGVVSRGLLQISKDSANQKAYGCGITDANQLHYPATNLICGVKILHYQAKKSGVLIDGTKNGAGAYFSTCRDKAGSGSYEFISSYVKKF